MFNEVVYFRVLVCAFNKEPIELSGFDTLYLESQLEFCQAARKIQ